MTSRWRAEGGRYERAWAGRAWALTVDAARPGLLGADHPIGPVLALDGISAPGRSDPAALGGPSLAGHEILFDRVEALYTPADWESLRVRATWSPRGDDGMDLEVQVQAFTVGDLESVEIHVASRLDGSVPAELPAVDRVVSFPSVLADLGASVDGPRFYLEMIHPDDAIRREIDPASGTVRYTLFGHDLERGVIVRGRLRGLWYATRPDEAEMSRRREEFLREPPPLGT